MKEGKLDLPVEQAKSMEEKREVTKEKGKAEASDPSEDVFLNN